MQVWFNAVTWILPSFVGCIVYLQLVVVSSAILVVTYDKASQTISQIVCSSWKNITIDTLVLAEIYCVHISVLFTSPFSVQKDRKTALILAVQYSDKETVKALVAEAEVKVNKSV